MTKIFISYRRDDSSYIAGIINEKLEQHFGPDSVFLDIDSIPLGLDFRRHIAESVGKCNVLLAIIGDSWINAVNQHGTRRLDDSADFVRLELEAALKRDIPVIPVLVGKARMPLEAELPAGLQELAFRNAAQVRAGLDLQEHLTRLVRGVDLLSKSNQVGLEQQQSSKGEIRGNDALKVSTEDKHVRNIKQSRLQLLNRILIISLVIWFAINLLSLFTEGEIWYATPFFWIPLISALLAFFLIAMGKRAKP